MNPPNLASRWEGYLSRSREGGDDSPNNNIRSPFHKDYDRILFSPAFRRLQDKTQVYPLAQNDNVRRRLTHSLEVASIGRCLGRMAFDTISTKNCLPEGIDRDCIGYVVASACLAHDIGNPPFGHAGEKAISKWFKKESNKERIKLDPIGDSNNIVDSQLNDFQNFDGNAQGFRILTSLEDNPHYGGMRLTAATLSTFVKYPIASSSKEKRNKIGVFQSELDNFKSLATKCKIDSNDGSKWSRNPLNFLMEAADDICYLCADVEDAFRMERISFSEAKEMLDPIAHGYNKTRYSDMKRDGKICYLVAKAIGNLTKEVDSVFRENFDSITMGHHTTSFMESIENINATRQIRNSLKEKVIKTSNMAIIECMGFEIIDYFLNNLVPAVIDQEQEDKDDFCERFLRVVPDKPKASEPRYKRILRVTDFISGMTDSYALKLYRELRGISKPAFCAP